MTLKTTLLALLFTTGALAQIVPTVHTDLSDGNEYDGFADIGLYGNAMYISNSDAGNIMKVDVSAPNGTASVFLAGLDLPTGLEVLGDELYFFQAGDEDFTPNTGSLWKINLLSASATPVLVLGGLTVPTQMDIANSYVYFVENYMVNNILDHSIISRVNLTGTPVKTAVTGNRHSVDDLGINGTDLYFVEWNSSVEQIAIFKVDISTATPGSAVNFYNDPGYGHYNMEIKNNKMYLNADDDDVPMVYTLDLNAAVPVAAVAVGPFMFGGNGAYVGEMIITDSNIMYAFGDAWNGQQAYVLFRANLTPLGIQDNPNVSLMAYPNPTSDYLSVSGLDVPSAYQIHDFSGKLVGTGMANATERIDVQHLQSGVYVLDIEGSRPVKFIKK